jgi:hypothetical protein
MKQTAVEWLQVQIKNCPTAENLMNNIDGFLMEAKEMEKQQIIDARVNGVIRGIDICDFPTKESLHEEHLKYYNETFNKGQ